MSFSHIALTVSDLPSAASFYAAALQPLGYRYIGKEGNALGFGVDSANFFISPGPKGVRVTPSHVAFHADSRDVVRQCYAAAVRAQGLTTGAPSCRNDDCECYNAAVEDLDGHMIEFIYRQPHGGERDVHRSPNFKHSCNNKATSEDDQSQAHDHDDSNSPRPGLARSKTDSLITGKGLLGMGVAAAAGAALMYSLVNTEKKNTKEEMAFAASAAAPAPAPTAAPAPPRSTLSARRAPTVAIEATPPTPPSVAQSQAKSRHRNFSATESHVSARRTRMLALEDEDSDGDEDDHQESRAMNLYEARRIVPRNANDQFIYIPASVDGGSDHYTIRRAATMPLEAVPVAASAPAASHQYLLGPPPPRSSASRRSSHHGARSHAVSSHSSRHSSRHHHSSSGRSHHGSEHSRHSHRSSKSSRSHPEEESSSRHGEAVSNGTREERSSRHDSAVSVARESAARSSTSASSSTVKPATRRDSVLQQSPGSKAGSKASSKAGSRASSHIDTHSYWPAGVALPPSVSGYTLASSSHSSGRLRPSSHYATAVEEVIMTHGSSSNSGRSHNSAARIPLPPSVAGTAAEAWEEEDDDYNPRRSGDDDNNVTDSELNPNDSISCVGISRPPRRRVHRSKHHRIREESGSEREGEAAEETPSAAGRRRGHARREEIEHGARDLPHGGTSRGTASGGAPGGSRFSAVTLPFRFRGPASARRSVHSYA